MLIFRILLSGPTYAICNAQNNTGKVADSKSAMWDRWRVPTQLARRQDHKGEGRGFTASRLWLASHGDQLSIVHCSLLWNSWKTFCRTSIEIASTASVILCLKSSTEAGWVEYTTVLRWPHASFRKLYCCGLHPSPHINYEVCTH